MAVDVEVVGRLGTVEPVGGRVGGLLSPPVPAALARAVELAAGLVAVVPTVPGRRVVAVVEVAVRFAAVAVPEAAGLVEADEGELVAAAAAGASSCCTTSKPSASDMLGFDFAV